MPNIDFDKFNNAQAIEAGEGSQRLKAGCYVAKITAVRTQWEDSKGNIWTSNDKEYVKLIFDIAEGEYAGMFSDASYTDPKNDWAHWACLSWKGVNDDSRRMGLLKGTMTAFNESNAGFDALAAFQADKWDLFVGKQIGLVIGEEEYETREGDIAIKTSLPNFRSVAKIKEGKCKPPALKKLKRDETASKLQPVQPVVTDNTYNDIPF